MCFRHITFVQKLWTYEEWISHNFHYQIIGIIVFVDQQLIMNYSSIYVIHVIDKASILLSKVHKKKIERHSFKTNFEVEFQING
jgi:hypothetical protein